MGRNGENKAVGGDAVVDFEAAKTGFSSIKAVLSAVCTKYKVCSKSVAQFFLLQILPQEIVVIGSKVEDLLSRIDALEQYFDSRPGDREELNRRSDVVRYVINFPRCTGR